MPPKPDAPVGTPSSGGYGLGWGTVSLPLAITEFLYKRFSPDQIRATPKP